MSKHSSYMTNLSKFLSLILRHRPEVIHISLDEHGWAKVDELLAGIREAGWNIDREILEEIVRTDEKQRYSFHPNNTLIRANQGHSIPVDVEFIADKPPAVLYHGTAQKSLESILKQGILSMSRLYVHLSTDYATAEKVGRRHGLPVVLTIDAEKMHRDGIPFFLSANGIWLTKYVDAQYLSCEMTPAAAQAVSIPTTVHNEREVHT